MNKQQKPIHTNIDLLQTRFTYLKSLGDEFWSFKNDYKRDHSHSYFRYPAMMVPQMIRKILDEICRTDPNIKHIHDPFVGSGTILTESMLRGLEFTGRDINPLSILLCKVKSGPFYQKALENKINNLYNVISDDTLSIIDLNFKNIDKWFRKDIQIELCRIRRSIKKEKTPWIRRFFWVAFAETVRLVSNSRTTTYKLHIREKEQIESRNLDVKKIFKKNLEDNFFQFKETRTYLKKNGLLNKDTYKKDIRLILGDAKKKLKIKNKFDLILTSPPYGDNHTTVTYGQYSYLPLSWIDLEDIDKRITPKCLENFSMIDSMSLGGRSFSNLKKEKYLKNLSPTYAQYIRIFADKPKELINKLTSFFYDLDQTLSPLCENLNDNGYLIWTLGNRTVGGINIELDKVLIELFKAKNIRLIDIFYRPIPNKRMASKNKSAKTMTRESIVIFKKHNEEIFLTKK
ncbi:site-specific DNA-methyltransferase [Arcobacter aquimarinus]|uniref:site-specific DNA-methyltransferase (cytosine-N(4)-specific) n=1 Tax=Arcobacter aquimarinus TaxID=1315211 RepID=A0AAE7E1I5_9BACT|nr:site-specific DNA-methyltransferase [Arcobacter aquimarinus]QKE27128.1 type II DNA methyltransferase [Arcobacter aquimarinus]RXI35492.1 DNA modification methylase [Arcobacter aquimarinus]